MSHPERGDLDERVRRDPSAHHTVRTRCRACDAETLERFLELGQQPLANSFLHDAGEFESEPRFPLDVYFCRTCFLVQLADVIDPEILFANYLYVTGTSDTIAAHNREYAKTVKQSLGLGPEDRVTEIASNDGSLLKCFRDEGVRTLGVEPATNIAKKAEAEGIETLNVFFGEDAADDILASHGPCKAVIGNNVLAHVDEPRAFLAGARKLLEPGGRVIVEVPHLEPLLERTEYDTVYHEHLCYFSVSALARLCRGAGLTIDRIEDKAVHGGTIRVYAANAEELREMPGPVRARIDAERARGLQGADRYHELARKVAAQKAGLLALLADLRAQGKSVVGYGAPAKGNTLLNYCDLGPDDLAYVVDKSPLKVGLYTPGTHIPVLPTETLVEKQPDYVLILAWNFAAEIMEQQAEYRRRGGAFILPIPEARIVHEPGDLR